MNAQAGAMAAPKSAEAPPEDVLLRNDLIQRLEAAEKGREYHHRHLREQARVAAACRAALEQLDGDQPEPAADGPSYGGSV